MKLLLKRGADGAATCTPTATRDGYGLCYIDIRVTTLDWARSRAKSDADCAETLAVLRQRCCNTCGMTSPGRAVQVDGIITRFESVPGLRA